jgi:hypothetical protein
MYCYVFTNAANQNRLEYIVKIKINDQYQRHVALRFMKCLKKKEKNLASILFIIFPVIIMNKVFLKKFPSNAIKWKWHRKESA